MDSKLELIIGPMFSGKSTELIRRIRILQNINKKVLVVKPVIDNRYISNKLTTHNYESVDCIILNKLCELKHDITSYDTIIIDEGQFFSDLKEIVLNWLDNYSINIVVAGLDGDYKMLPIGQILDLIPYSNKCKKLNSLCCICKDGTPAPFTLRSIKSDEKVLIGGSESYKSVCRKHYNLLNNN